MTRKLLPIHYTTPEIEQLALELGARKPTIYQWRRRGVPASWKIKIFARGIDTGKVVKLSDFKHPKKQARK